MPPPKGQAFSFPFTVITSIHSDCIVTSIDRPYTNPFEVEAVKEAKEEERVVGEG
jgi:hypothetical protein